MSMTVQDLARACNLEIAGGDPSAPIHAAANIDAAGPNQLSFIANERDAGRIAGSRASALIVPDGIARKATPPSMALLYSKDPEIDFIRCLSLLYPVSAPAAGVSAHAHVDPSASIGAGSFIDAGVTVGRNARIGRGCAIHAGCHIAHDVEIGDGCTLYPNVVLYHGTVLRENVVIHAGTAIGSDGFGYKHRAGVHIKFPQVGTVLIERDVEIGSNTCIDRASLGRTVIGAGSKIDNHVHIAHNVQIGKGVLICGQTGIGGSTVIEDYVVLASQSGVADHVRIGRGAKVLAQAGVIGDVESGAEVVGFPAADRKQAMRETVTLRRLVDLYKPLKALVELLPKLNSGERPIR